MPIHDWSKVDANLFHDFHQAWTIGIRNALNGGILPKGFSALVEQRTGGIVPDVLSIEDDRNGKRPAAGGTIVAAPRSKTRHVIRATKPLLAAKANRIAIHHPLGDVVCVIEIVSPGNKSSRSALGKFVDKSIHLLQEGIHLLVVDLFPPTARDPQGIHKAIWDEIEENDFTLPADEPLTLAAYLAGDPLADLVTTAFVEPLAVGKNMPDMPAYLNPDAGVDVPLQTTYDATWQSCPEGMREFVERQQ
jgi:hypothetical protein